MNLQDRLRSIVGAAGLLDDGDREPYEQGARYGTGRALMIVRPATVEQVCQVVQACAEHRVPVLAQGANTGLVAASTPDDSGQQVLLSLTRLRQPLALDAGNRSVDVGAGLRLHALNEFLDEHGFWFPIDLSADPTVGGMVATNTGGTRLIRYGDVRRSVLALDVVLFDPPGRAVRLGRGLRKDNTGPDLKQLFIGTAGAFGIVVGATLEVRRKPRQTATALVVPVDADAVGRLLAAVEDEFGDHLAAFEGMSRAAVQAAIAHVLGLRNPFHPEPLPPFSVLIELESSASPGRERSSLQDRFNDFLQDHFGTLVENAAIGDRAELWSLRHALSEGARALGRIVAFDISVPRGVMMAFRERAAGLLAQRYPALQLVDFGHIADGGLHFNVVWPHGCEAGDPEHTVPRLRDEIYALAVEEFGGSFSAEHGIGPHNASYYQRFTDPSIRAVCGRLKTLFDPHRLAGRVEFGDAAAVD